MARIAACLLVVLALAGLSARSAAADPTAYARTQDASVGISDAGVATSAWVQVDDTATPVVMVQRQRADGSLLGAPLRVSPTSDVQPSEVAVAVSPTGTAIVVWHCEHQLPGAVRGVRWPADGSPGPVRTLTVDDPLDPQLWGAPVIAFGRSEVATVAWGNQGGLWAAHWPAADAEPGTAQQLRPTSATEGPAALAVAQDGTATFAWNDTGARAVAALRWSPAGSAGAVQTIPAAPGAGSAVLGVPALGVDPAGDAVLAWAVSDASPDEQELHVDRWPAGGSPAPSAPFESAGDENVRGNVAIGVSPGGAAVIGWTGLDGCAGDQACRTTGAGGTTSVRARSLGADGTPGTEHVLSTAVPARMQTQPVAVRVDGSGRATVAWTQPGAVDRLHLTRLTSTGGVQADRVLDGPQEDAALAVDPAGVAVATWTHLSTCDTDLRAARWAASGTPSAPVVVSDTRDAVVGPQVGGDAAGDAAIADQRCSGGLDGVELRRWSAAGDPGAPIALSAPTGSAGPPSVATDASGTTTVAWSQDVGGRLQVLARRVPASGDPGPVQAVSAGADDAYAPRVSVDSAGNALVVFAHWHAPIPVVAAARWPAAAAAPSAPTDLTGAQADGDLEPAGASGVLADDGTATVAWSPVDVVGGDLALGTDGTAAGDVLVRRWPAGGAADPDTWSAFTSADPDVPGAALAVDPSGTVHVAATVREQGPYYPYDPDVGEADWAPGAQRPAPGALITAGLLPLVAADGAGDVFVAADDAAETDADGLQVGLLTRPAGEPDFGTPAATSSDDAALTALAAGRGGAVAVLSTVLGETATGPLVLGEHRPDGTACPRLTLGGIDAFGGDASMSVAGTGTVSAAWSQDVGGLDQLRTARAACGALVSPPAPTAPAPAPTPPTTPVAPVASAAPAPAPAPAAPGGASSPSPKPAAVTLGSRLGLPAAGGCLARRRLVVRPPAHVVVRGRTVRVIAVALTVAGRRVPHAAPGRSSTVSITAARGARVAVAVTATTATHQRLHAATTYHRCGR